MFKRLFYTALDNTAHLLMLARLRLHDWIAGPPPETPLDRSVREEGERLFPKADFDDPTPKRHRLR